jgi:hypothetical protein
MSWLMAHYSALGTVSSRVLSKACEKDSVTVFWREISKGSVMEPQMDYRMAILMVILKEQQKGVD